MLTVRLASLAAKTEESLNHRYTFLSNTADTLKRHDEMLSRSLKALQILQTSVSSISNLSREFSGFDAFLNLYSKLHITFYLFRGTSQNFTMLSDC